ncbi:hypothetical protein [Chromobacterium sphagni]|uniref:Uncharacterized protein n=1 Tax=Chromobacterium sphagni TaxID=1903179 RepID=A0ABX3CE39_9NEIS|nr:hypothetical protein [Chromobacterium sphagni]OHX20423.1 hypothetical protein BI344_08090 [Chromobacterium sphagni]
MASIKDVTPAIIQLWLLRPTEQRRRIDVQPFVDELKELHPNLIAPLKRGRWRPYYDPMMLLLQDHLESY